MSSASNLIDEVARALAIDPTRSVLVEAPAGSGKTTLLTNRFLALLACVDSPTEIVAITFTNAAAAEMRHRILSELERAEASARGVVDADKPASELAIAAWQQSEQLGWKLLDQPAQLRITTIDSFCRELALQQPLLSSFGGELNTNPNPKELYREAVRRVMSELDAGPADLRAALYELLDWRDNSWQELETELIAMLGVRHMWLQRFLIDDSLTEEELREWLEAPLYRATRQQAEKLSELLAPHPDLLDEILELAKFGATQPKGDACVQLVNFAAFPPLYPTNREGVDRLVKALNGIANIVLLAKEGQFRKAVNASNGFPASNRAMNGRVLSLMDGFRQIPTLDVELHALRSLPSTQFTADEWRILRACFTILRRAAVELKVLFAERGMVDFTEVSLLAQSVLDAGTSEEGESAFALADQIHHILVDEFQDTSRKQHRLIASILSAWSEGTGRTVFVVGDPMQSIYLFRSAEAELFRRTREQGLSLDGNTVCAFEVALLQANFRTTPELVDRLNEIFKAISNSPTALGFEFNQASPQRPPKALSKNPELTLHLEFAPQSQSGGQSATERKTNKALREQLQQKQIAEIVELCRSYLPQIDVAREKNEDFRVAILGRTKKHLIPIAEALRTEGIAYRALALVPLVDRPEIQDALALAKALHNPEDRLNWLGVLRAPWCGLELTELHKLVSKDEQEVIRRQIPSLLKERASLLSTESQQRIARVVSAYKFALQYRSSTPTATLGSWIEAVWLELGGAATVDEAARVNLNLLWRVLDALPNAGEDLLNATLTEALRDLTAQPDPAASTSCGIQLMTIHKSKGLEFEVVIVPELQSPLRPSESRMLSWLEREGPADALDETEFLIAPKQQKGSERGSAKAWVDGIIKQRELAEQRRLFYVAATRAREELHLFARPAYRDAKGQRELTLPGESLLKACYPAFEAEIEDRFVSWLARQQVTSITHAKSDEAFSIAAEANVIAFPTVEERAIVPVPLRRLPDGFVFARPSAQLAPSSESAAPAELYQRQQGGLHSRLIGRAIHRLFEFIAKLRLTVPWSELPDALSPAKSRIVSEIRSAGLTLAEAETLLAKASEIVSRALDLEKADSELTGKASVARWLLDPHAESASEVRWAARLQGELRHLQVDRIFQAGTEPLSSAQPESVAVWWIVDYKSAHLAESLSEVEIRNFRELYAQQLETYARVLRKVHGTQTQICCALFYPSASVLDHWAFD